MPLNEELGKYALKETISISQDKTVEEAIVKMVNHRFRRFPVVNDDNKPVGMLSSSDILTMLHKHSGMVFLDDSVENIMTEEIVTIDKSEPVKNAILLMYNRGISGLPITDDEEIAGIFTAKDVIVFDDLWREIPDKEVTSETGVGRPINPESIVSPEDGFWEVATVLFKIPQREVLVRDKNTQSFVGFITNMTILKVLYQVLNNSKDTIDEQLTMIKVKDMEVKKLFHKALPTIVSSCRLWMNTRGVEAFPLLYRNKPAKLITEKDLFGYLAMNIS